jgi:hypothetical protein
VDIFYSAFAARLILILGFVNLITGFLILFSCRIVPAFKPFRNLMQNSFYKKFFRYHSILWWIFWISVIVHAVFAMNLMGWPF